MEPAGTAHPVTPDAAGPWHLRVLGRVSCGNAAEEIALHGGAVGVLAYLAVHRCPVSRSALAGLLWPEVTEHRARGNLRSALWRLGRHAPGLLAGDGPEISIDPATRVDYWDATAWMERVLSGRASTADLLIDPDRYGRDLVPGYDADWVCLERERLRQAWIHTVEQLARGLAAQGWHGKAICAALTAIAADPLRESAHRAAVECHLAEHNIIEARRAQRAYARLLGRELGIEPSQEFQRLVDQAIAPRRPARALVNAAG